MPNEQPLPHADFYVGRGANAEYLGTIVYAQEHELHPHDFQSFTEDEFTEDEFREIAAHLADWKTWPHKHADSSETRWTYAYDTGSVYVYRLGVEMLVIRCNTHRTVRRPNGGPIVGGSDSVVREWRPVNNFPNMRTERTPAR